MLRILFKDRRVNPARGASSAAISRRSRFLAALLGIGLTLALLVASQLRPDPRGWGTHEQLGLPKCTFLALVGKRCPACGMTTSWAYVARGQMTKALRTHVAGTVLALVAAVVAGSALVVAVRGKRPAWPPSENVVVGLVAVATGLITCEWVIRVWIE